MAKGKRTGGRLKGTPNKASLKAEEIAASVGCDPLKILCQFASGDWKGLGYSGSTETRYTAQGQTYEVDTISKEQRLRGAQEAAQYILPKRKAIDHTIKPKIRHEVLHLDGSTDVYTNEDD